MSIYVWYGMVCMPPWYIKMPNFAHLQGRLVAPLRRTPMGFLDLDRLDAYTQYLLNPPGGSDIVQRLSPRSLTPAQFALCHRLGLLFDQLDEQLWLRAFYPTNYALQSSDDLHDVGKRAVSLFTQEFVACRWPRLSESLQIDLINLYSGSEGLVGMARQLGLEHVLDNILGWNLEPLPRDLESLASRVRLMVFPKEHSKLKTIIGDDDKCRRDAGATLHWSMTSLIGAIWKTFGGTTTRRFLDARLFSATCALAGQFIPEAPMVEFTKTMRERSGNPLFEPEFRLLHESGRLSAHSIFIVGVFDGQGTQLGRGCGQSILMAQKRACIDALRGLYFVQLHDFARPSESMDDAELDFRIGIKVK